jgi:uncharacterized protein
VWRRHARIAFACVSWLVVMVACATGATGAIDIATLTPQGYVTDVAGVLAPGDRTTIESYLADVDAALASQFAVVIVESVEPVSIEEFAVELFEKWGVGDRSRDQGLLLCVATADRAVRFETGYGLEGALPDGKLGGIIRAQIVPRFRAGDYAGGILDALVEAARAVAESQGVAAPVPGGAIAPRRSPEASRVPFLMFLVVALIVFAIVARNAGGGRGGRHGGWGLGGGPWYGGGFGGGGFGGGGFGGFGGGGSGGGFGGFGGGSSGGGGASGSW